MNDIAENRVARRARRWRIAGWAAALLLSLPLAAMQFTDAVHWTAFDFLVAGAMLAGAGGTFALVTRTPRSHHYRIALGMALATAFLLVWINGAVGIIGAEDDPANLMFAGVLAVGAAGSLLARLRPPGMARALLATALAQALAGVIAQVAGWGNIAIATSGFTALWLLSAWLFRKSGAPATFGEHRAAD